MIPIWLAVAIAFGTLLLGVLIGGVVLAALVMSGRGRTLR